MSKRKLTLYIDEETGKLAKRTSRLSGKSISVLVEDYFKSKSQGRTKIEIDDAIRKWIGVLKEKRTYKELREDTLDDRLKKYEGSD